MRRTKPQNGCYQYLNYEVMRIYFIICISICLSACQNETQKIATLMKQVIGHQIDFPEYSEAKILGKSIPIPDTLKKEIRIIIYTPPLLCTSCNLDCLEEWKILMQELKGYSQISFTFIFKPHKEKELTNTLKEFAFDYPVIYDTANMYIKKNKHVNHPIFFTLLLNSKNQAIIAGNPIGNEALWNLYKQEIQFLLETPRDSLSIE